jgi:hypothetical protein
MNTKWLMGMGLLTISNVALSAGWQESQRITEYFIDGADSGERLYVGFEQAPNPDSCGGKAEFVRVNGHTEKGKYLFSIILSAHAAKQAVRPKLEGCDAQGHPILTGLRVVAN